MPEQRHPWLNSPIRSKIGQINLAGSLQDTPGIRQENMRILGSYALVLITEGNGYYLDQNGCEQATQPGDAIFVFPDIAHAYGPDSGQRWSQSYVIFEGPCFDLLRENGVLDPTRPVWHFEPVDRWKRRIEELFQSKNGRNEAAHLATVGRFLSLLTEAAAAEIEASRGGGKGWLDEAIQLLSEPQARDWLSPQEVALRLGMSYENFRKLFPKETGESPAQFQKRRRIEHACAAIYQDTASFKQLAEQLGFCDVYHFSRVFRQITGETPSAYRKRIRGD